VTAFRNLRALIVAIPDMRSLAWGQLTVRPQRSATAGMGLVDFLLGIAFMAFLTVGLSVTPGANSGPEFWAARIVFGLAALSAAAAYFRWVLEHPRPLTAIILFAE